MDNGGREERLTLNISSIFLRCVLVDVAKRHYIEGEDKNRKALATDSLANTVAADGERATSFGQVVNQKVLVK